MAKRSPESLCWSCTRAYAFPDPKGCAFHRKEHKEVFDEAIISLRVYHPGSHYKVVCVTRCRYYELSARDVEERKAIKSEPQIN
jgi:hypothetical protein